MKLLLAMGALLLAQSTWAADLKVTALECTALNSLGYANLKLDRTNKVSVVVNSTFRTQVEIEDVGPTSILLLDRSDKTQYRLEFSEALKAGAQKASGTFYAKYTPHSPYVLVSYANCRLTLE